MDFDLKRPCANCPFRTDIPPFLRPARAKEILDVLIQQQGTFACHKTVDYSGEDGAARRSDSEKHCAGATILLEKIGRPNQLMRIAERLRMYDPKQLDMSAAVFDSPAAMIKAMKQSR
jgi:hypothetical protein